MIGLSGYGWLTEASKRPFVRSVWNGTSMVGCSTQLRVDVGESRKTACCEVDRCSIVDPFDHWTTWMDNWYA